MGLASTARSKGGCRSSHRSIQFDRDRQPTNCCDRTTSLTPTTDKTGHQRVSLLDQVEGALAARLRLAHGARWPYASITIEAHTFPALVLDWQQLAGGNGYQTWHARCLYFDSEPNIALVPTMRVRAAVPDITQKPTPRSEKH